MSLGILFNDLQGWPHKVSKFQDCSVDTKILLPIMYGVRSSSNKKLFYSRRGIPPTDLKKVFFERETFLEEADGQLNVEEKVMQEKSYN